MNPATEVGLAILILIAAMVFIIGWLAFSWDFCDKHKDIPLIGYMGVYFAPYIIIGLILVCYGLVEQAVSPTKEEPMKTFRTDEDRRLAEHLFHRSMRLLIKHYRNGDSIDKDIIYVINTYENLNGTVETDENNYYD